MQAYFDNEDGKPKVLLEVMGSTGEPKKIAALIDTGHSGKLSLPLLELVELGAILKTTGPIEFGNGAKESCLYFDMKIKKDPSGDFEDVYASLIGSDEAIVGTELFLPYILSIDFKNRKITVELSS